MYTKVFHFLFVVVFLLATSCRELDRYLDEAEPRPLRASEFVSGLTSSLGLAVDPEGRLWVTEVGTGNNDGKVSVITPEGEVHPVVTGFTSVISPEGVPAGLGHLLYRDGSLYILDGTAGRLYVADVSSFQPGDQPLSLNELPVENIGKFVLNYPFEEEVELSNIYNLTFGPDGALYITDAGANAIIRRSPTGELSVFATIPDIENPTEVGPPTIDGVPTGIVYDGEKFLVTTLTGFPFPAGEARIYQIDRAGNVSLFQDGLTTLVDIALGADNRPLVLQIGTAGEQGFAPNTGQLTRSTTAQNTVLLQGLNLPTDIERRGLKSYYVTSLTDGKILKVE